MRSLFNAFLILSYLFYVNLCHKCIHSEIAERLGPMMELEDDGETSALSSHGILNVKRELQSSNTATSDYRPMRIYLDFSNVNTPDSSIFSFIKDVLATEVVRRLSDFIMVNGPTTIPAFSKTSCDSLTQVPSSFSQQSTSADLILLVGTIVEESNYVAYAAPCLINSATKRPIVGAININLKYLEVKKEKIEIDISMIIHEVMHVLVLSPTLFNRFPIGAQNVYVMEKRTVGSETNEVYKLITPGIIKAGREHFACDSFSGLYLENEGSKASAGSHFEKILAGNEIMTAQATGKMVISFWIMHLLNDSGWYKVDFSRAEPLYWGKNKGCTFANGSCSTEFSEFCKSESSFSCSADYMSKNRCVKTPFSNDCYVSEFLSGLNCNSDFVTVKTALFEERGANSRCFETSVGSSKSVGCYRATCTNNVLTLQISSKEYTCTNTGDKISVDGLVVTCPNISDFCGKLNAKCENDCSGNGKCLINNNCYCNYFTSGSSCETPLNCTLGVDLCRMVATAGESGNDDSLIQNSNGRISASLAFVAFIAVVFYEALL